VPTRWDRQWENLLSARSIRRRATERERCAPHSGNRVVPAPLGRAGSSLGSHRSLQAREHPPTGRESRRRFLSFLKVGKLANQDSGAPADVHGVQACPRIAFFRARGGTAAPARFTVMHVRGIETETAGCQVLAGKPAPELTIARARTAAACVLRSRPLGLGTAGCQVSPGKPAAEPAIARA
jgi:hypothetical protein